ncbi:4445_t:CDS:2, partial [Cetraspora pellucida]
MQPTLTKVDQTSLYSGGFLNPIGDEQLNLTIGNKDGLQTIVLVIDIKTSSSDLVNMFVFDSEYDPYDPSSNSFVVRNDPFTDSLVYLNTYLLESDRLHTLRYVRKIRKTIINTILGYIGFRPEYNEKKFIESEMQSLIKNSTAIKLVLKPRNFLVEVQQEQ